MSAVPTFSQLVLRLNWETLWLKPHSLTFRLLPPPRCLLCLSVYALYAYINFFHFHPFQLSSLFLLAQVAALEGEVRHLKHKVRGHQEEACQLSEKVGDIERRKDQKEKEQQKLLDQLRISQQQVRKDSLLSSSPPLISTSPKGEISGEIYRSVELWPGSCETGSRDRCGTLEPEERPASQPIEAEQFWAQPNTEQAEGSRVRGHKAQGQFKSEAHTRREGKAFVCSVEPWSYSKSSGQHKKKNQMHLCVWVLVS